MVAILETSYQTGAERNCPEGQEWILGNDPEGVVYTLKKKKMAGILKVGKQRG